MHPRPQGLLRSHRDFLTSTAGGVGLVAFASLVREQGLLASQSAGAPVEATMWTVPARALLNLDAFVTRE